MRIFRGRFAAIVLAVLLASPGVSSASVEALFDLSSPSTSPFPSNRFTVFDLSNRTNITVDLPKPDCAVFVSRCEDIDVINTLDGFNLQPRLSIPFSGPIDVTTVDSDSVFLINLGDTTAPFGGFPGDPDKIGVDQIVFDPETNTLHAESDELLEQHTKYALIVTDDIRDTTGNRVQVGDFAEFRRELNFGRHPDRAQALPPGPAACARGERRH